MKKIILFVFALTLLVSGCKSKKESAEFFKRANYHFKKNELEKALHFYNEAIKKNEDFADAYQNRGILFLKEGKIDLAIKDLETAIQKDNEFYDAKLILAKTYSESGKLEESSKLFDAIKEKMKDSSQFHNFYGQNAMRRNQQDLALFAYNEAIRLNPKNIEALTNFGYLYIQQYEYEKALNLLNKALAIDSKFSIALNNIAFIKGKQGNYTEALEYLNKIIDGEKDQIVVNNKCLFELLNGNLSAATSYLLKSGKIDEANIYYKRNSALIKLKNNKSSEALNELLILEKTNPEIDYLYFFIGEAYWALNDKNNACKNYKKGVLLKDGKSEEKIKLCNL
jgi:tetratricopeptide (TPR) repeat protein